MIKKLILPILFICISIDGFTQISLLTGLQLDAGVPMNVYDRRRGVLGPNLFSNHLQGAASLQLRLWDRIGLEGGISQTSEHWRMHDNAFADRHPGFKVDLRNKNNYYSYFGNLQIYQRLSYSTFLYIEGGYYLNKVGTGSVTQTKKFERDDETITATSNYKGSNTSISTGFGIQKKFGFSEQHMISVGLRLNMGKAKMMEGDYKVYKSGYETSNDKYNSFGSFMAVNVKYSLVLLHKEKREKKPKPPLHQEPDTNIVVKTPPETTTPKDSIPKKVEGRDVNITHKITVQSAKIKVKVWDHQTVDGDRISIFLNDHWILINYTLEKSQKIIEVELREGNNYFVLHALNLGKYPPNTAAIIIDDGVKENEVILESTLESSGTIEINFTK